MEGRGTGEMDERQLMNCSCKNTTLDIHIHRCLSPGADRDYIDWTLSLTLLTFR